YQFFLPDLDIWMPLTVDAALHDRRSHSVMVFGRLAPAATLPRAQAEMDATARALGEMHPDTNAGWSVIVDPVHPTPEAKALRPALLVLMGAAGLVLLIACANVANLLLARSAARHKEIAVRAAIGAARSHIVRQVLTESLLLAGAGALAGLVLGVWGARALLAVSPGDLPRAADLARAPLTETLLDWRLLAFTAAIAAGTGILFGLAPALHLAHTDLGAALKEGGERGSTGVRVGRTRGGLVIAELALSVVLLVGAMLLIRTFVGLRAVDPGFDPKNVLTLETSIAGAKYETTPQVESMVRQVVARVDGLPGIEAAAVTISLP